MAVSGSCRWRPEPPARPGAPPGSPISGCAAVSCRSMAGRRTPTVSSSSKPAPRSTWQRPSALCCWPGPKGRVPGSMSRAVRWAHARRSRARSDSPALQRRDQPVHHLLGQGPLGRADAAEELRFTPAGQGADGREQGQAGVTEPEPRAPRVGKVGVFDEAAVPLQHGNHAADAHLVEAPWSPRSRAPPRPGDWPARPSRAIR